MVSSTPRPHFTPGKDPVPVLQEAGWAPGPVSTGGKSRPHRDSIPDRPARSPVAIPTELPGPHIIYSKGKGKAVPLQAWSDPEGSRKLRFPDLKVRLFLVIFCPESATIMGILLEAERDEISRESKVERIFSVYHKTDILDLETFFRENFSLWAGNGSCV